MAFGIWEEDKTTADWLVERKQAVHWRYLMSQLQLGKLSLVLQPMDYKTLSRMSWCMVTYSRGKILLHCKVGNSKVVVVGAQDLGLILVYGITAMRSTSLHPSM